MSQRPQLRLIVSNNSKPSTRKNLPKLKPSPVSYSASCAGLRRKMEQLNKRHPGAAALIEKLIDDALDDLP